MIRERMLSSGKDDGVPRTRMSNPYPVGGRARLTRARSTTSSQENDWRAAVVSTQGVGASKAPEDNERSMVAKRAKERNYRQAGVVAMAPNRGRQKKKLRCLFFLRWIHELRAAKGRAELMEEGRWSLLNTNKQKRKKNP